MSFTALSLVTDVIGVCSVPDLMTLSAHPGTAFSAEKFPRKQIILNRRSLRGTLILRHCFLHPFEVLFGNNLRTSILDF